jgi:hypothetical protein
MPYVTLTTNMKAGSAVRYEMLDEVEHIVVPMVMIVEGVHNGSQGPVLYEAPDMQKVVHAWNHKPILNDHPLFSNGTTACDVEVINKQRLGIVLNNTIDRKNGVARWRCEAWLNIKNCADKAADLLDLIEKGEMVEVSTGLFINPIGAEGTWNEESYTARATDMQPDHLAILLGKKGACSIQDGGGLLQNADKSKPSLITRVDNLLNGQLSQKLNAALVARLGETWSGWLEDHDPDNLYLIYWADGKLFRLKYKVIDGATVTLSDDSPTEVVRAVSYSEVSPVQNGSASTTKGTVMDRAKQVDLLIANGWTEDQRDMLTALPETQFGMLMKGVPTQQSPDLNSLSTSSAAEVDWEKLLPSHVVNAVKTVVTQADAEKKGLVEALVPVSGLTANQLSVMDVPALKALQSTLQTRVANYGGRSATAPVHNSQPVVALGRPSTL